MAVQDLYNETFIFSNKKSDFTFVTVIVCNKNLKTNRISHGGSPTKNGSSIRRPMT